MKPENFEKLVNLFFMGTLTILLTIMLLIALEESAGAVRLIGAIGYVCIVCSSYFLLKIDGLQGGD